MRNFFDRIFCLIGLHEDETLHQVAPPVENYYPKYVLICTNCKRVRWAKGD